MRSQKKHSRKGLSNPQMAVVPNLEVSEYTYLVRILQNGVFRFCSVGFLPECFIMLALVWHAVLLNLLSGVHTRFN